MQLLCILNLVQHTVTTVHAAALATALSREERLRGTAQKGCFCVRNGSIKPTEEGFTKQTQVMLLGKWCAEDVA
jgi:hypothetical protein